MSKCVGGAYELSAKPVWVPIAQNILTDATNRYKDRYKDVLEITEVETPDANEGTTIELRVKVVTKCSESIVLYFCKKREILFCD